MKAKVIHVAMGSVETVCGEVPYPGTHVKMPKNDPATWAKVTCPECLAMKDVIALLAKG